MSESSLFSPRVHRRAQTGRLKPCTSSTTSGPAAYESLERLAAFLSKQAPRSFVIGSHARLYDDSVRRLHAISAQIKAVVEPAGTTDPRVALEAIYREASLEFGSVLLSNRLQTSLRLSLTELLTSDQPGIDPQTAAKLLAAEDVLRELRRYSGSDDYNQIARDIEKAQFTTKETLKSFVELFQRGIRRAIDYYMRTPGEGSHKEWAELCIKLLAAPEWPRTIPPGLCGGAQLSSLFPGGPKSIQVTWTTLALPYERRACGYRDFLRASRIFQSSLNR